LRERIAGFRVRLDLADPDDVAKDRVLPRLPADPGRCAPTIRSTMRTTPRPWPARPPTPRARPSLLEIARVCRARPEKPAAARSTRRSSRSTSSRTACAQRQLLVMFQLGRPDRYLLPFYWRDLAAGTLTVERAQELIDHLCLMLSVYTPPHYRRGLYDRAARWQRARCGGNELTRMFL